MGDDRGLRQPEAPHRYATPTGSPCPRTVRADGSVDGSGACLGCGLCLLFGGLFDAPVDLESGYRRCAQVVGATVGGADQEWSVFA
jgi:hypothetical protein